MTAMEGGKRIWNNRKQTKLEVTTGMKKWKTEEEG
jgi:hypothetical protein